jgi:hypothetical protein
MTEEEYAKRIAPRFDAMPIPDHAVEKVRKYGNVHMNGYDSKREAKRAAELQMLERMGIIRNLREQVRYLLIPKQTGERSLSYVADFVYECDGLTVVEDAKGVHTRAYIIKRKLMLFVHGIKVIEV